MPKLISAAALAALALCALASWPTQASTAATDAGGGGGGGEAKLHVRVQSGPTKVLVLTALPSVRVGSLKEAIEKLDGHPKEQQELLYGRQLLENEKTLAHYNLAADCQLSLALVQDGGRASPPGSSGAGVPIVVAHHSEENPFWVPEYHVQVEPGDTVAALKHKLRAEALVAPARQRLMYEGRGLEDAKRLLDYGVRANSKLILNTLPT